MTIRDKYIEERHPPAMVFGEFPDGRCDIMSADTATTIAAHVTPEQAATILAAYNALHGALVAALQAFDTAAPVAFKKYWYG
ncbi:MAG TPA: hypothetical protein VNH21_12410 [Steroidobacteraceae bacterium]|nr:hypothetical protein [Steroidobacteraceae bacterium]